MIFLVLLILLMMVAGVGIAWALAGAGLIAAAYIDGLFLGMKGVAIAFFERSNSYVLVALPLYLLMGEIVARGGISSSLFKGIKGAIPEIRGSLYYVTILCSALFAAVTGSSVGSASFLAKAIHPEMVAKKYSSSAAAATIATAGTLGILIPPSITMIIYGSLTSQSIGRLFIAGVAPGIILASLFMIAGFFYARRVPPEQITEKMTLLGRIKSALEAWPFVVLLLWVIIAIYTGLATPTEVAAVAVVMAAILSAIFGQFSFGTLISAAIGSCLTSSMIIFIMCGAESVAYVLKNLGLAFQLLKWIQESGISPLGVFATICIIYTILGMLMDGISMMCLTVPFFYPVVSELGFDPIWFGVVVTVMVELCLITPPVGLNLFVVSGACNIPVMDIFKSILPYIACVYFLVILLLLFPGIATGFLL